MIVRDVLKHPELLDNFDWYNDGDDTIRWLIGGSLSSMSHAAPAEAVELALKMREKCREYFAQRGERR